MVVIVMLVAMVRVRVRVMGMGMAVGMGMPLVGPEQQGFDDQRRHVGGLDQFAHIDEIKLAKLHPIQGNDIAGNLQLVLQDNAQAFADIAFHHQDQRLGFGDAAGEALRDALGEGEQARIGGLALPLEGKGGGGFALGYIEAGERRGDGLADGKRIDIAVQGHLDAHHRHVAHRQGFGPGDVDETG